MSQQPSARPPFALVARFPGVLERVAYRSYVSLEFRFSNLLRSQNFLDNSLYPVRPLYFGALVAGEKAHFVRRAKFKFVGCAAYFARNADARLLSVVPHVGEGAAAEVTTLTSRCDER